MFLAVVPCEQNLGLSYPLAGYSSGRVWMRFLNCIPFLKAHKDADKLFFGVTLHSANFSFRKFRLALHSPLPYTEYRSALAGMLEGPPRPNLGSVLCCTL